MAYKFQKLLTKLTGNMSPRNRYWNLLWIHFGNSISTVITETLISNAFIYILYSNCWYKCIRITLTGSRKHYYYTIFNGYKVLISVSSTGSQVTYRLQYDKITISEHHSYFLNRKSLLTIELILLSNCHNMYI